MADLKYILEPGSRKHICLGCGKKSAVRYIDKETKFYLPEQYSRCDREINCSYHLNPYKDGFVKALEENKDLRRFLFPNSNRKETGNAKHPVKKESSYIDKVVLTKSLQEHKNNNFCTYLISLLGPNVASQLVSKYFIGNSQHWQNSTVFWQIDQSGKIRTGKIMLYHPETGRRIKQPFNHITWVHSTLNEEYYQLSQCLFGEHLLKSERKKPIALVESEKTAIIASAYLPKFVWLATGGLSNLNYDKCRILASRSVTLFPDLNGYDKWSAIAKELSSIGKFTVSSILECTATAEERKQGLDLADYLIKLNYQEVVENPHMVDVIYGNTQHHNQKSNSKPESFQPEPIYSKKAILEAVGRAAAMNPTEKYSPLENIWQELLINGNVRLITPDSDLFYFSIKE